MSPPTPADDDDSIEPTTNRDLIDCVYTCAGANRRSGCCATTSVVESSGRSSSLLAYGASHTICIGQLIDPDSSTGIHLTRTLFGHAGPIVGLCWPSTGHVVNIGTESSSLLLVSIDTTFTLIIWKCRLDDKKLCSGWTVLHKLKVACKAMPNSIDALIFPSSAAGNQLLVINVVADTLLFMWKFQLSEEDLVLPELLIEQRVDRGSSLGLCLRCSRPFRLPSSTSINELGDYFTFIGTDLGSTEVWTNCLNNECGASLAFTLPGHQSWVRCIDLCSDDSDSNQQVSFMLATGSQDNVIRLWHIKEITDDKLKDSESSSLQFTIGSSSTTSHRRQFLASPESVLSGHENWITGVCWAPNFSHFPPRLLTSSSDNSLIVWSPPSADQSVWVEQTRLGNFGAYANLSLLDCFWLGADMVGGHHLQGSLSFYHQSSSSDDWSSGPHLSGHFGPVSDLDWSGSPHHACFLLTAGADQTVRAHVPCSGDSPDLAPSSCWHELARPQLHGYDMAALACLPGTGYASAGEEKIIRLFTPTQRFADSFKLASGHSLLKDEEGSGDHTALPDFAIQPPLGLSNQLTESESVAPDFDPNESEGQIRITEPFLHQKSLWPEVKKLYGHASDIYCVAAHPTKRLLASACLARTREHAEIIVWDGQDDWDICQRLIHHQLTVVQLAWDPSGQFLVAVSRDRTWSLWQFNAAAADSREMCLIAYPAPKIGHSRIIWTCSWTPDSRFFLTGSRDASILVWPTPPASSSQDPIQLQPLPNSRYRFGTDAVTAISTCLSSSSSYFVAVGFASGLIRLLQLTDESDSNQLAWTHCFNPPLHLCHTPGKSVRRLRFHPRGMQGKSDRQLLASGADDGLVRLLSIDFSTFDFLHRHD